MGINPKEYAAQYDQVVKDRDAAVADRDAKSQIAQQAAMDFDIARELVNNLDRIVNGYLLLPEIRAKADTDAVLADAAVAEPPVPAQFPDIASSPS